MCPQRRRGESIELTENQKAWLRLKSLWALMERARNLELAKVDINIPQAEILYSLKTSAKPLTPSKLARTTYKQPHTTSALVHRMEKRGLVSTKRDLKRKNWVRVSLTKKGDEALKRWYATTVVPDAFSSLSEEEVQIFRTVTDRLRARSLELIRQLNRDHYDELLFW